MESWQLNEFWGSIPVWPVDTFPGAIVINPASTEKVIQKLVEPLPWDWATKVLDSSYVFSNGAGTRQEVILVIPLSCLMSVLTHQADFRLPEGVLPDSLAIRTYQDENTHAVCIVLAHPSYVSIDIGYNLPKYDVVVENHLSPSISEPEDLEKSRADWLEEVEREV